MKEYLCSKGRLVLVVLLLAVLVSCFNVLDFTGSRAGVEPTKGKGVDVFGSYVPPEGTISETGVLGPGALYEIWVPEFWNLSGRRLVLYVHGYINPEMGISLPQDLKPFFLNELLARKFAVAYTSFSDNGWAVKDGAIRTRQLLGYFKQTYGGTKNVFLIGSSEGGIIALMLAETNPNLFAGTMSLCSLVGGAKLEMEYILNVRILFDYFFKEHLSTLSSLFSPESDQPLSMPDIANRLLTNLGEGALDAAYPKEENARLPLKGQEFTEMVAPVILYLLSGDPVAAAAMASIEVDGLPLFPDGLPLFPWDVGAVDPLEFAITISTCLWYNIYGTADIFGKTHNHVMVDNSGLDYEIKDELAAVAFPDINKSPEEGGVERLVSTPDAEKYLDHWYQPSGKLKIPLFTLHTTRDPIVPRFHEDAYVQIVQPRYATNFHKLEVDGFGHCEVLDLPQGQPTGDFFSQILVAFESLVSLTQSGN